MNGVELIKIIKELGEEKEITVYNPEYGICKSIECIVLSYIDGSDEIIKNNENKIGVNKIIISGYQL
jgi:hypothetical protein